MLNSVVQREITKIIEGALAPVPILNIELVEGQDYDLNDVIFVTVRLPSGTGPLPPSKYVQAIGDVSRALLQANDERLPLFRTMREGESYPADEALIAAS